MGLASTGLPPLIDRSRNRFQEADDPLPRLFIRYKVQFYKNIMGDRSPKSNQKKASQKASQSNAIAQKKQQLITSQQATKAKAAAAKKK